LLSSLCFSAVGKASYAANMSAKYVLPPNVIAQDFGGGDAV
jgi:hypothetical protein